MIDKEGMICKIVIEEVESGIDLRKKCCSFDCFRESVICRCLIKCIRSKQALL